MATKQQIQRNIARKLVQQQGRSLTGAFVESAVLENITRSDWNAIAGALSGGNQRNIGKIINGLVDAEIAAQADQEATAMLADDSISLDEYSKIEGLP